MANVDIPAWVARVQAHVANHPQNQPPLERTLDGAVAAMEATNEQGVNFHQFSVFDAIPIVEAYYAAVDARNAPAAGAQPPPPAGSTGNGGRRRRRKTRKHRKARHTNRR